MTKEETKRTLIACATVGAAWGGAIVLVAAGTIIGAALGAGLVAYALAVGIRGSVREIRG